MATPSASIPSQGVSSIGPVTATPDWQLPNSIGPHRIVCLTEESTEWLYLLGQQHRIVGISGFTVRPAIARLEKPKVSAFTSAKIDKILALKPDFVIGFSDLQADIAAKLIRCGIPVTIFNQRSVSEIFTVLQQIAALVGCQEAGLALLNNIRQDLFKIREASARFSRRPLVYFEEWNDPLISGIEWVSELVQIAGGDDCFSELARQPLAKDRIIADPLEVVRRNPDIIIGSWCGKKFTPENVKSRPGYATVNAIVNNQLYEIKSPNILQPGIAALTDGVRALSQIFTRWANSE